MNVLFKYVIVALFTCLIVFSCNVSPKGKKYSSFGILDSLCLLKPVSKEEYNIMCNNIYRKSVGKNNHNMSDDVKYFKKICYLKYYRQNGEYEGVFLFFKDQMPMDSISIFRYRNGKFSFSKKELLLNRRSLYSVYNDSTFYSSRQYISDGSDEMLASMYNESFDGGIFYWGCSTTDIKIEKYVVNKDFFSILLELRKILKKNN